MQTFIAVSTRLARSAAVHAVIIMLTAGCIDHRDIPSITEVRTESRLDASSLDSEITTTIGAVFPAQTASNYLSWWQGIKKKSAAGDPRAINSLLDLTTAIQKSTSKITPHTDQTREEVGSRLVLLMSLYVQSGPSTPIPSVMRLTSPIGPSGGVLALPLFGTIEIPQQAVAAGTAVTVSVTAPTIEVVDDLKPGTLVADATFAAPALIRVNVGSNTPQKDIEARLVVPDKLRTQIAAGKAVSVYSKVLQQGFDVLDYFVPLTSAYDAASGVLTAAVPGYAFSNNRNASATHEAHLLVGISSAMVSAQAATTDAAPATVRVYPRSSAICGHTPLASPLRGIPLMVTGPFFDQDRTTVHWGVDYAAADLTPVHAMKEGFAYLATSKTIPGAGHYIIVLHLDMSVTKYMHLTPGTAIVGSNQRVQAGEQMARSGSSGTPPNKPRPHLHIEYWPPPGGGDKTLSPIDADACTPANDLGVAHVLDVLERIVPAFTNNTAGENLTALIVRLAASISSRDQSGIANAIAEAETIVGAPGFPRLVADPADVSAVHLALAAVREDAQTHASLIRRTNQPRGGNAHGDKTRRRPIHDTGTSKVIPQPFNPR